METELRDKIIETHTNVAHLAEWARKHEKKDEETAARQDSSISWMRNTILMGIGGLAVLQFVFKLFLK